MITRTIYVACDECMDQVELDLDSIGGWWNLLLDMGWKITYNSEAGWERTCDPHYIDTTTCPVCVEYRNEDEYSCDECGAHVPNGEGRYPDGPAGDRVCAHCALSDPNIEED